MIYLLCKYGLLKLGIDGKEFQESYYLIKDKIKEYIIKICKLINSNAQTNGDTGFHIHISTIDKSLNIDFYRL